jgi:tRNA nucleotidyltransferase (CCA-adding enzyme)
LLHDVGKPRTRAFSDKTQDYTFYDHERVGAEIARPMLERLRFSNEERDRIVALIRHHLVCYDPSWSDAAVRRWIRRVTPELVEPLYALNDADVRGKGVDATDDLRRLAGLREHVGRVLAAGAALSVRELCLNGHDLMRELGLPPGRIVGEILGKLLEEVIEQPELNERSALLARARVLAEQADQAEAAKSPSDRS